MPEMTLYVKKLRLLVPASCGDLHRLLNNNEPVFSTEN